MTRAERQTLARKLAGLRRQLELLQAYRPVADDALLGDGEKRLAVERLLERCIQSVIDISRMLVTVREWRVPGDERDALRILADRDVLDAGLADRLLKVKGFRNVLVHDYVGLDLHLLIRHLRDDAGDLWAFARRIAACVSRTEVE